MPRLIGVFTIVCSLAWCFGASAQSVSSSVSKQLQELKKQGKKKKWSFSVGYSEAMDSPLDRITGLKLPKNWRSQAMFVQPRKERGLPAHFDWREEVGGLTPIKNQGQCGSCWAFGTVAVMESLIKIRDGVVRDISEQHLVSCNRHGYSCGGGYFEHGLHVNPGAVYSEDFGYKASNLRCKKDLPTHEKLESWAYVGSEGENPTVDEMKNAIYQYGPLGVTVAASRSFQAYRSGVYDACDGRSTNHIVSIVGWDDTDRVWILRNSWGEKWGEKGYMRIRWNCNRLGELTTFANYKPACTPQPVAVAGSDVTVKLGDSVRIGAMPMDGQSYSWTPSTGLDDATSSSPLVTPTADTVYTLKTTNSCGTATKTVSVKVINDNT